MTSDDALPSPDGHEGDPNVRQPADQAGLTRRGFIGALLAAIGSALAIGIAWLIARGAPSAGRDPEWPPDSLE